MRASCLLKILVMILGILTLCVSCNSAAPVAPRDTLRIQLGAEPVTLDPSAAEDGMALNVLYNVMDGLVANDVHGRLEPRLAESYRFSENGKRIDFKLRPGIQWSDGKPITAQDFVVAFQRALDPKSISKIATMISTIKGAVLYRQGKIPASQLGVRAEGADHLILDLEHPAPYFIAALTLPVALPLRQDVLDSHGGHWPADAPVTGAYRIASHQTDQKWSLEKNPHYWGSRLGPEKIEYWIVRDDSTAVNLFRSGKLDILTKIPLPDLEALKKEGVVFTHPLTATYYISFNLRKAPFDNPDMRRAVAGSIRREELVKALQSGEIPARSWIPPSVEGHIPYTDPTPVFADSIAKVAKNPPKNPIQAGFDSSSRNSMVMEKIQSDLAKTLGIQLSLLTLDWKSYIRLIQTDAPPIYRFGWLTPFMDPISQLQAFTTHNPSNYAHYSNPVYDRLVDQIEALAPGAIREKKIEEAQRVLVDEDAAVVPIYHYVQLHAVSPRVQNFDVNTFGSIPFGPIILK